MKNMIGKVHTSMYQQCQSKGFAAPVDILIDIGILDVKKYDDWKHGRVPYLEAVCVINLHKLSEIMKIIRAYAVQNDLRPSVSSYCQIGTKSRVLRFSKSGNPNIEKAYATHYVGKILSLSRKNSLSHDHADHGYIRSDAGWRIGRLFRGDSDEYGAGAG